MKKALLGGFWGYESKSYNTWGSITSECNCK
jgi:hypothetical protein